MRLLFVAILFLMSHFSFTQDVIFGANFGVNPFNKFKFINTTDYYKPINSFYTYTSEQPGTGIIVDEQKFFITVHFGLTARVSRKKIGFNFEPQFVLEYSRIKFNSPYRNTRVLSNKGLRLPMYFTYHLFNNPLALHLNAGIILTSVTYYDYQQPDLVYYATNEEPYVNTINGGDNHFYNVFYDKSEITAQYLIGFGKRINRLDYNLRYVSNLSSSKLTGTRWQIELHMNFFFLSKEDFSTKNHLYEE